MVLYGLGMVWYNMVWYEMAHGMVWTWYGVHTMDLVWFWYNIVCPGRAFIMVVIDMSDSAPAVHYNSLPRIAKQRFIFAK